MASVRISGRSEKLGSVSTSSEFLTWEVPDDLSSKRMRRLLKQLGKQSLTLDEDKYSNINLGNNAHATLIINPEFSEGRDECSHQVRFG